MQTSDRCGAGASAFGLLPTAAALAVYLAVGLHLLWPGLFGGQVLSAAGIWTRTGPFPPELSEQTPPDLELMSDSVLDFVPWLRYAADCYRRDGRIPLWKDTALCGAPFVGNGQSAMFFPTVLPAILLGAPDWVHAAQALAKLAGGALCAWLLARHLGLSFLAALACGLVFGFGGFQGVWLLFPLTNVSLLLPLLLLAADRVALEPTRRNVGLLALVAGVQQLGGHPETAFHCQTVALACAAVRSLSLRARPDRWRAWQRVGAVAAGLTLGAAIGAVQVLPLLEYMSQSEMLQQRQAASHYLILSEPLWSALFVVALVTALVAFRGLAKGTRHLWLPASVLLLAAVGGLIAGLRAGVTPAYVQTLAADWFGDVRRYLGPANYLEHNGAFAGAALPLAVLGLLYGRPRGPVRLFGVLLGVGLLVGFNAPAVSDVLRALPVFGLAANLRLQFLALLASALLAGFGLDALGRVARELPSRRRLALAFAVPALSAVAALALALAVGFVSSPNVPFRAEDVPKASAMLLPDALGAAWYPLLPERVRCEEDSLSPEEGRLFTGVVAVSKPLSGVRLVYGRDNESVFARSMPLIDIRPEGLPLPDGLNVSLQVFHAVIPHDQLLPEPAQVRAWVGYVDGSVALSPLIVAPDDAGPRWLPYPGRPAPGHAEGQLWLLAATALLAVLMLHARGWWRGLARVSLVVLVGVGLHAFVADKLQVLPPELFYPTSPAIRSLHKLRPDGRMYSMESHLFCAEISSYYGIADVRGYDVLYPLRVAALLDAVTEPPAADATISPSPRPGGPDLALLGLMSVKALTAYDAYATSIELQRFRLDPDPCKAPYAIATNPEFLPRARLVGGSVVEADDARALQLLRDPEFDRRRNVLLASGEPRAAPDAYIGNAAIVVSRPEQVRVAIAPTSPGWLVLSDTFFPGWRAVVDGEPREILRANLAFRAVPVQPGEQMVEFRYEPFWFRCGLVLSLVVGSVALLACLLPRRRPPAPGGGDGR